MKRGNIFKTLFFTLVFGSTSLMATVAIPTGLDDPDATDQNITLTWDDSTGEIGYTIYSVTGLPGHYTYSKVPGAEGLVADTTTFTVNSVDGRALSERTTYNFSITATYQRLGSMPIESDKSTPVKAATTHTWDGELLNCLNDADHIPTRTELESTYSFICQDKGLTEMNPIRDLKNLHTLTLNRNSITGFIPTWIEKLTNLSYLNLSENQFSGTIPTQIWSMTSLTEGLSMASNNLTGSIPPEIKNLTSLQALDLSDNELTGSIPVEIGKLKGITLGIDLSDNNLTGVIPSEIGDLNNTQGLNLSNNKLTGTIPPEIVKLTMLTRGLDLSDNNLTGVIPAEIGDLNMIDYLYLSHNQLSGEIPTSITKLVDLESGNGLKLTYNCHLYNKDIFIQTFISEKSSSFSGYSGIEATNNGNCQHFNLVPVTMYLLD